MLDIMEMLGKIVEESTKENYDKQDIINFVKEQKKELFKEIIIDNLNSMDLKTQKEKQDALLSILSQLSGFNANSYVEIEKKIKAQQVLLESMKSNYEELKKSNKEMLDELYKEFNAEFTIENNNKKECDCPLCKARRNGEFSIEVKTLGVRVDNNGNIQYMDGNGLVDSKDIPEEVRLNIENKIKKIIEEEKLQ